MARRWLWPIGMLAAGLAAFSLLRQPAALDAAAFAARYATPLPPPAAPLNVYHLGHSLVGRDMPAMLAQMAGHDHASQLGWGTPLKAHWEGPGAIEGFAVENDHPHFRPAKEALESGDHDAVVLTEMVEIRAAIRYHNSPAYLARWAALARKGNPDARIYLYETWHQLDDPEGFLTRIDLDMARYWQDGLLRPAMAKDGTGTIFVVPGGQVMAAVVRAMEAGRVPGLTGVTELFRKNPDGTQDNIHFNDLGAYVVALTHYAALYQRSPVGLPHALRRADGTPADAMTPAAAAVVQAIVWDVVRTNPLTGIADPGA